MFASTRHLIYQTLCLTPRNNDRILTPVERKRLDRLELGYQDVQLRLLSYMGERGLLQYTRKVYIYTPEPGHIRNTGAFTPDTLLPHIHHFRSLDHVHAMSIEHYSVDVWKHYHERCFAHFYPTLTSLTLRRPFGQSQSVLQFALRFPNLENLCLEWPGGDDDGVRHNPLAPAAPTIVDQPSLARGHLRLVNFDEVWWPMDFVLGLRNRLKFRSVELDRSSWKHGQYVLNACADTIQDLAILSGSGGYQQLDLTRIEGLRRLAIRPVLHTASQFLPILTITSTVFCELVLALGRYRYPIDGTLWGHWTEIDKFLYERFAQHGPFRVVVKAGNLSVLGTFRRHADEAFPLLASRGYIHFEVCPLIDKAWD
ncbi:hypothetical protein BJ322DRAFT_1078640 [Thelephora terrestris]|uniref:Uncharacterized protein n=1 Tax=Thelephora terrestris TaxID=56493 RepID=A0A9P6HAS3_9AGAM|nr:hypothetical protein BJ322DRAFT_1078640 [Thelephora terrestris]